MPNRAAEEGEDKDVPLREDIRLLGRILGDTIREQSGQAVFDIVEQIRQNSVRFRREEDGAARRELEATLNSLPPTEALQVIRAFSFFSHLSNIAEDQHHIRRTRAHVLSASTPREGSMAYALARARQAGVPAAQIAAFFAGAIVAPVLTAHPTEVRARKSVESRSPLDGAGLQKAAIQCATRLKRARLLQLNMELQLLMREAENAGEVEAAQQLRRQFSTIHRELRTIDSAMHLHG
jgi:phosphoenolpyruvate carboxylase